MRQPTRKPIDNIIAKERNYTQAVVEVLEYKVAIHMKTHYQGLDFLRGLGVMMAIILHTAFYFYKDLYDVDLANPTPIITIVGFLLMFAGLFAMISGMAHTTQFIRHEDQNDKKSRIRYMLINSGLLLILAYVYFLFTGPGIVMFATRQMDESLFVALINQGRIVIPSVQRLLYVDSLVMLSFNILLLALFFRLFQKRIRNHYFIFVSAIGFLIISYVRIPLYAVYLDAEAQGRYGIMVLLNWFANKNHPIFPFFAFALFGAWLARLLASQGFKALKQHVLIIAPVMLVAGVVGYLLTPETMLQRAIDPTWYFIMVMQIGLFMLLILLSLWLFDIRKAGNGLVGRFVARYGVAGLTPFFLESTVSALIFFLINLMFSFALGLPGAIVFGVVLAVLWGLFLAFWQKHNYRYGVEWVLSSLLNKHHQSSKLMKLKGATDAQSHS